MAARRRGDGALAGLINSIGFVLAAVLVAQIVLRLFDADPSIEIVGLIGNLADWLALWWPGLIDAGGGPLQLVVDYGIAAMFWVLVAAVLARAFG